MCCLGKGWRPMELSGAWRMEEAGGLQDIAVVMSSLRRMFVATPHCYRKEANGVVWELTTREGQSPGADCEEEIEVVAPPHCERKLAMGSSARGRFILKASISSSVGSRTSVRLLYGRFLSSTCIIAITSFWRCSSASRACTRRQEDKGCEETRRHGGEETWG